MALHLSRFSLYRILHTFQTLPRQPWIPFCLRGSSSSLSPTVADAMAYALPPLPYSYDSLEPYVDTMTMQLHHDKHHQTYVNNVNAAIEKHPELKGMDITDLSKAIGSEVVPGDIVTTVRDNGGGHWNHSFFWKIMCNPSSTSGPQGELKQSVEAAFGSVDAMREKFNAAAAARFGSGWAWLIMDHEGNLDITSTPNQDNPLMTPIVEKAGTPILGLDVWEHAYYLKYQNRRPEYIAAWWNVVNWEAANENFKAVKLG